MALTPEEIAELAEFDEALSSGEYPSDIKRGRAIHLPIEEGESTEEYLTRLFNTGRPNLGQTHATGTGRSPKRQVRLSPADDDDLTFVARTQGRTISEVMRTGITRYVREQKQLATASASS